MFSDMSGLSTRPPHDGLGLAAAIDILPAELVGLGVEVGHWALATNPVSSLPHLTYARDLDALQCRVGATRTDRVHWRHGQTRADAARTWREPRDEHVHSEPEVRVVVQGQIDFRVRVPGGDDVAHILCGPGTWIVLPAGVLHACRPTSASAVEMLRLFQPARDAMPGTVSSLQHPPLPERVGRSLPRPWRFAA